MKASTRLSSLMRNQPILLHHLPRPTTTTTITTPLPLPTNQTRTFFGIFRRKHLEDSKGVPLSIADLLEKKPQGPGSSSTTSGVAPTIKRGDLSSSSLFEQQDDSPGGVPLDLEEAPGDRVASHILQKTGQNRIAILKKSGMYPSSPSFMAKYRIRMIKRRGRLSASERIMRSEKEHLCKSHNFKTSLKKLGPIARQIAGKPLEHALVQMRYSPKKAAKEVLKHLVQAKNEAILTKNFDPEQTYISQAWVGRGTPDKEPLHRARGRIHIIDRPYTSISVILKENKTLERLAKQKEEKRLRQKVWVPMANRPIYGQHQYYQW